MLRRALGVAGLLLVGFGAQQAGGAPGTQNGLIVYEHVGTGNRFQIYSVTATGAHRRSLTHGARYSSYDPAFSPSGKQIVFVRAAGQTGLWTMHPDGTHKRRLTVPTGTDEFEPAWSPGGKEIAYSVEVPKAQQGIWLIGADGDDLRRLTTGDDVGATWSPDGTKIAFDRFTFQRGSPPLDEIYVVPASGGSPTDLTNDPNLDPITQMQGNVVLAESANVAAAAVKLLGLHERPSSFMHTYTVASATDRIDRKSVV